MTYNWIPTVASTNLNPIGRAPLRSDSDLGCQPVPEQSPHLVTSQRAGRRLVSRQRSLASHRGHASLQRWHFASPRAAAHRLAQRARLPARRFTSPSRSSPRRRYPAGVAVPRPCTPRPVAAVRDAVTCCISMRHARAQGASPRANVDAGWQPPVPLAAVLHALPTFCASRWPPFKLSEWWWWRGGYHALRLKIHPRNAFGAQPDSAH